MIIASEVRKQIERSSFIRRMFEEGIRMKAERGAENVFDFSLGNPSEDPPAGVLRAFRALAERSAPGSHGYMPNPGFPEARETVARRLREATGVDFTPGHVLMTAGCAGAMNAALKAILNPGEEVIVPMPCFPDYAFYIGNYGGVMVPVETREDFSLDVGAIEAKIGPRTRAIILNSPHNPSGVIYPEATLRKLEAMLAKAATPIMVLSDEPYTSIVYDGARCPQLASIISNCMITTSWSKKWGLAGERIGYLAVSPRVPDALALAQACAFTGRILGFINAPAIWQLVVAEAPDESTDLAVYQEKRELMCDGLERAGYEVRRPQGAFYVFLKTPIPDDFEFVHLLQEEGVLAVPGSGFGRKGYMRLSLTVPRDTVVRSLPAFARALEKLRA